MPSITTHHFFAQEVLNHLEKEEIEHIQNEQTIYYTFAQSHDYLFYYTFDLKNAKRIKELGHRAHHEQTQNYLLNILREIKEKHLEDNQQAVAYLYGSITHYCLDATCHPYIFYKTGICRKGNKESYKYRGEHTHMERDLDAIYYEKYKKRKYKYCNINKEIIKKPLFTKTLTTLVSDVYKKTYNEDNIGTYYQKGIKNAKIINFLAINDYLGIKELIYKGIDFLTNNYFGHLQAYSTHNKNVNLDFLNREHKEWNHPCFPDRKYKDSFEDLFNQSLQKAIKIIKTINTVLYENKSIEEIEKYIPDLDYATGLPIEESRRMDYFE